MFVHRNDPIAEQLERLGISAASAERLSQAGTLLELAEGTVLCEEGDRGDQAFLLLAGEAEVQTAEGPVNVSAVSVIGEIATLDLSRRRNATVVAASPVMVLVLDIGTFRLLAADEDLSALLSPNR